MKLDAIQSVLEESKTAKKGIVFYVKGATVIGYVVSYDSEVVEARNQKSSRVLIFLDSIDAVELS